MKHTPKSELCHVQSTDINVWNVKVVDIKWTAKIQLKILGVMKKKAVKRRNRFHGNIIM